MRTASLRHLGLPRLAVFLAALAPAFAQNSLIPPSPTAAVGYAGLGFSVGRGRIVVGNDTGSPVLYTGGGTYPNSYWVGLAFKPSTSTYEPVYVSRAYDTPLRRIAIGDVTGGPGKEIVVALTNGQVFVHDQITKALLLSFVGPANSNGGAGSMCLYDLDGDGKDEILIASNTDVYVYSGAGALLGTLSGVGGDDVLAGQFDGDPSPEIVTSDGHVIDWATRSVQWYDPNGFGVGMVRGDIDGDGMDELIAAHAFVDIRAYDVDLQQVKWSIPESDLGSIDLKDVDGNGTLDVIVGENQFGSAVVYDTTTLQQIGSVHNPDAGIHAVCAGDFDQDGVVEVAFATGANWTGPKHVIVGNPATGAIEWKNVELDGPMIGPLRGDLDGDGQPEIVVACSRTESAYSGRLLVLDPTTLALRAMSPAIFPAASTVGIADIALYDVDGDGTKEIIVAGDSSYSGYIQIYHFTPPGTFTLIWTNATHPNGAPFYSVAAADVDGDGALEIIGGGGMATTGASEISVYVYSYATHAEEWHSPSLSSNFDQIQGLAVSDLDGDGIPEIVALPRTAGIVSVFDGATKALEGTLNGPFTCVDTDRYYVGSIAHTEIVAGAANGDVARYERVNGVYTLVAATHVSGRPIDKLTADDRRILWAGSRETLRLHIGLDPHAAWVSEPYGHQIGAKVLTSPGATPRVYTCSDFAVLGF